MGSHLAGCTPHVQTPLAPTMHLINLGFYTSNGIMLTGISKVVHSNLESCHDTSFVVHGGTRGCHYNLQCHQWWQSWHHSNSLVSLMNCVHVKVQTVTYDSRASWQLECFQFPGRLNYSYQRRQPRGQLQSYPTRAKFLYKLSFSGVLCWYQTPLKQLSISLLWSDD